MKYYSTRQAAVDVANARMDADGGFRKVLEHKTKPATFCITRLRKWDRKVWRLSCNITTTPVWRG